MFTQVSLSINVDMRRVTLSDMVLLHKLGKCTSSGHGGLAEQGLDCNPTYVLSQDSSYRAQFVQSGTVAVMTPLLLGHLFVSAQFGIFPGGKNRFNILC